MEELSVIGSWSDVDVHAAPLSSYGIAWQGRGAAIADLPLRSTRPVSLAGAAIPEHFVTGLRSLVPAPHAGAVSPGMLPAVFALIEPDFETILVPGPPNAPVAAEPRTRRRELTAAEESAVALFASCALTIATEDWGWSGLDASMFAITIWLLLRWAWTSRP